MKCSVCYLQEQVHFLDKCLRLLQSDVAKYVYEKTKNDIDKNILWKWKDAKHELPPQDNIVLVYLKNKEYAIADYIADKQIFKLRSGSISYYMEGINVTHWMYLPNSPD